jgi:hypothetical protein
MSERKVRVRAAGQWSDPAESDEDSNSGRSHHIRSLEPARQGASGYGRCIDRSLCEDKKPEYIEEIKKDFSLRTNSQELETDRNSNTAPGSLLAEPTDLTNTTRGLID